MVLELYCRKAKRREKVKERDRWAMAMWREGGRERERKGARDERNKGLSLRDQGGAKQLLGVFNHYCYVVKLDIRDGDPQVVKLHDTETDTLMDGIELKTQK